MSFWTDTLGCETKFNDAGGRRTRVIEAGSVGHWPQFEQAETVNRILVDFLKRG